MLTTSRDSSQLHVRDAANRAALNHRGRTPAPSAVMYIRRKTDRQMAVIPAIFMNPFCLNEKLSFLSMISSPRKSRITCFLHRATGTRERAFSPSTESDRASTASPDANAMSIAVIVPADSGMQSIMAGSMVSETYMLRWK